MPATQLFTVCDDCGRDDLPADEAVWADDGASYCKTCRTLTEPRAMSRDALHPTEFIAEEVAARGWTPDELVRRMGGHSNVHVLALCLYFAVGPTNPNCRMGADMAAALGRAFDISAGFFLNLEAAWLASLEPRA